jgi:hypothetical protein
VEGLVDGTAPTPLAPVAGDEYLEARVEEFALPLYVFLKVKLGEREERFDFAFYEVAGSVVTPAPAARATLAVPATVAEIVTEIQVRDLRLRLAIHRQEFTQLYVPAFEAKDLALALEERVTSARGGAGGGAGDGDAKTDLERRRALARAVADVVRGAWLVDFHGDQGDRDEVLAHYETFRAGVEALVRLFPLMPDGFPVPPESGAPREKKEAFR